MKFSPDLFKVVDHCQYRSFITNKYSGARIAVDCGQCDYCIHKKAKKASMRVKTAGSAFEHCWFVTLTYDNVNHSIFKLILVLKNRPAHNSGLAKAAIKVCANIQVYVRQPSPSRNPL